MKRTLLLVLISASLFLGFTFSPVIDHEVSASPTVSHKLDSAQYETVYYDPTDTSSQRGVWIALISLVPQLKVYPILSQLLGYLGLGVAISDLEKSKQKKPSTRFVIEKLVYKAKKTTSSYWGYYEVNIYNSKTKVKYHGKHKAIGKTAY